MGHEGGRLGLLTQQRIPILRRNIVHRIEHLNDIIVGIEFLHLYDPSNLYRPT
jgi:hypothetical protein